MNNCGLQVEVFVSVGITDDNLSLMIIEKTTESLQVEFIDNLGCVIGLLAIVMSDRQLFFQILNELIKLRFMNNYIVRSDANLSEVVEFSIQTFDGWPSDISRLINDHWAFATEFKYAWNEIFSSSLSYQLTFFRWSCEHKQIESLFIQANCRFWFSLNDFIKSLIKAFGYHLCNDHAAMWSELRWFDDNRVSSCHSINHWSNERK